MNNNISYLNRNFDDYKESLLNYVKEHYPQIANDFDDASIGSWLIDLVAAVGDNLSFYIDKAYAETNLDTAKRSNSVYNIARSNGFKVPGPKGSVAEVEFSCSIPAISATKAKSGSSLGTPDYGYAPIIKKGTRISSRNQVFEVMDDIDFASRVNKYMVNDLTITPKFGTSNTPIRYTLTKSKVLVTAGESKIYRQELKSSDITPFMEIILPDVDVMNVESIIFKDGANYQSDPTMNEFMMETESGTTNNGEVSVYRFFEVNSLAEQYRWGDDVSNNVDGNEITGPSKPYNYLYWDDVLEKEVPVMSVCKGKWVPLTQKFITEFTDKGYLKITFGTGEQVGQNIDDSISDISKYQMSKMIRNNFLGKLPNAGWTMYVLYRTGGGASSNVAANTINNIVYYNLSIGNRDNYCNNPEEIAAVKNSITVNNPKPSVSGKDAPTVDEIKAMIKYNNSAQERCVTVKDYENRIALMPPRYGCPYKVSVTEENNKVMMYMLGIDYKGKLSADFPDIMLYNMIDYLSMYKSINDYIEIKAGNIINLGFEADIFVNKNYKADDVAYNVANVIKSYMDISKHSLGEDIFIGDLEKNISNVDGVLNLIELRIYNLTGSDYSSTKIAQRTIDDDSSETKYRVDIDNENYILNSNVDSMFEIKYPDNDITIRMIAR